MYSRRDFARMGLVAVPLSKVLAASAVRVGATTLSFRELPRTPGQDNVDAVIRALQFAGVSEAELSAADTEAPVVDARLPEAAAVNAYSGAVREITPEDLAAAKRAVRNGFRKWRLYTPDAYYTAIRRKFDAAGIALFAYTMDFDDEFTDAEIDGVFRQAKALGVGAIASSTTLGVARRLASFAEKHQMMVAFHNAPSARSADAIVTPASFARAGSRSPFCRGRPRLPVCCGASP